MYFIIGIISSFGQRSSALLYHLASVVRHFLAQNVFPCYMWYEHLVFKILHRMQFKNLKYSQESAMKMEVQTPMVYWVHALGPGVLSVRWTTMSRLKEKQFSLEPDMTIKLSIAGIINIIFKFKVPPIKTPRYMGSVSCESKILDRLQRKNSKIVF